jgi:lipopolysaccharide transport system ATP-binding protein
MSDIVVRGEKLGKRYRIGERERYLALRDVLARALSAPARFLKAHKPASPNGDPTHIWALKDVSFEVHQGEVVGIIGRNGAGKTTLLKILARVTRPTEGRAQVTGRVGSLLEVGTGFHPELTGRENVLLSGAILGMSKAEILRKFDEVVAFAEVERFIDTPLKHYSSGMQMRLAFAVAAHLEPEILLVDEVLAVGDLQFQKKCLGKMGDAAKTGRTILFVSHQMNQIHRLCEKVLWMEAGQIEKTGPTAEVVGAYEVAMTSRDIRSQSRPDGPRVRARFLRWEIAEPRGENPYILSSLGPVTVRFILQVNDPIRNGHHGIALFSRENQMMWGTAADGLELESGAHELAYTLPFLPVQPGAYFWLVTVFHDGTLVDLWNALPELIVAAPPMTHRCDEWRGLLNVPCRLRINGRGYATHGDSP